MSRSFVRAWATVATIMAMVCLAFVQPMPEHVSTTRGKVTAPLALTDSAQHQVGSTVPFVDSISTGKTFTPYATISALPLLPDAASRRLALVRPLDELRSPPLEPPTRPG